MEVGINDVESGPKKVAWVLRISCVCSDFCLKECTADLVHCPCLVMPLVIFYFLSGDEACRAEICDDATVGTFNTILISKGSRIPPGGYTYVSGIDKIFHSDDTDRKVANASTAEEK